MAFQILFWEVIYERAAEREGERGSGTAKGGALLSSRGGTEQWSYQCHELPLVQLHFYSQ